MKVLGSLTRSHDTICKTPRTHGDGQERTREGVTEATGDSGLVQAGTRVSWDNPDA